MFGAQAFPKITTGTDLVPITSGSLTTTSGSATVEPMTPMDTIREVFFDIRDSLQQIVSNTLETNELLKVGVLGTPADQRDEAIRSGETDSQGNDDIDDSPGFVDRLRNLNPFKGGLGNFGKVLLAILGLVGLNFFRPQLEKGFAGLLEFISDMGNPDSDFNKKIDDIKTRAETAFNDFKDGVEKTIEFIKTLGLIIKNTYESIETYINSFDTDGIDGLSEEEKQNLKDDVQNKITTVLADAIGDLIAKIKDEIVGIFALPVTVGLAITAVKNSILGVDGVENDLKKKKPGKFRQILGKVGLIAAIGLGVIELIDKSKEAYADAITDEMDKKQNFDFSEFVGNFFGGDGKGIFNSFSEMFKQGAIGTAVGAGVGLTLAKLGFAIGTPFGPIGMATGALTGFLIGSIVGAVGGFFGGEKISNLLDSIGEMVIDTATSISDYYKGFISGIKDYLGIGVEGMDTQEELDEGLAAVNKDIEKAANRNLSYIQNQNRLNALLEKRDEILNKMDSLTPGDTTLTNLSDIDRMIGERENLIGILSNKTYSDSNIGVSKRQADQEMIQTLTGEILDLQGQKDLIFSKISGAGTEGYADRILRLPSENRVQAATVDLAGGGSMGGMNIQQNIKAGDNLSKVDNNLIASFTPNNPYITAMLAGKLSAMRS